MIKGLKIWMQGLNINIIMHGINPGDLVVLEYKMLYKNCSYACFTFIYYSGYILCMSFSIQIAVEFTICIISTLIHVCNT